MSSKYYIEDVFRPTSFPIYTYVNRKFDNSSTYEMKLQRALRSPGRLISITGASKTGKTVLCHRVIPKDSIIDLSGAQIQSQADFWNQIAERIHLPNEVQLTSLHQDTVAKTVKGDASLKFPFTASGSFGTQKNSSYTSGTNTSLKHIPSSNTIINYLIKNNMVLVIDDFHYIDDEIQLYIARILKSALFDGLKAVILSLPHRADDAVKHNSDLIGRTTYIEIESWKPEELAEIARQGFKLLGYRLEQPALQLLTQESISSPQLMQQNCLNLAYNIKDTHKDTASLELILNSFKDTAADYSNYDDILEQLLRGPAQGRTKRKHYALKHNVEKADIYLLLLLAMSEDPPVLSFSLAELRERLTRLLSNAESLPRTLSISNAVAKMENIMKKISRLDTIEWKRQRLYILDPFLLFYLRWSEDWKHIDELS